MYLKTSIYIILLVFFTMPFPLIGRSTILVNDQSTFDRLTISLADSIKSGVKELYVNIYPGTYVAKENHLRIQGINAPDTKIKIAGTGAIIVPRGHEYKNGDRYIGELNVNNSWMSNSQDLNTWSDVRYSDNLVEIVNEDNKICRLKCKELLSINQNDNSFILLPQWYYSNVYKIDRIKGNYIYFTAQNLKKSFQNGYSINGDFHYGKKGIRFKLFNEFGNNDCLRVINGIVHLPSELLIVREGSIHRFITILDCRFQSVEISGIKFWGNSYEFNNSAISFSRVNCQSLWLHDCEFRGMHSNVISIASSPNVIIEKNLFSDCYCYGIQSDNNSKNTIVRENFFDNMGKLMLNTFCIVCRGENYLVTGNKMVNYGYGGIGVGVHYNGSKSNPSFGVVENNEMTFTDDYMANIDNYGIMDSGAIYLWTKNDGAIIRNNYIHGYSGAYGNRGIFCDDGAYNYQIYGNIITNIANSYCIASRREPNVEITKTPESGIEKANVNNVIRDNIVDGEILFVGHEDIKNGCVKGANYILMKKGEKAPKNTIKNIINPEEDIPLEFVGLANGKHYITSQSYRQLKKSKSWKNLRKYVEKY